MGCQIATEIWLVENPNKDEIINQLQAMLDEARLGKVIGLVIAAHNGADEFTYCGAGSFCSNPHLAATALNHLRKTFFP